MNEQVDVTTITIVTIEATWVDILPHIHEVNTSTEKKTNASRKTYLRRVW